MKPDNKIINLTPDVKWIGVLDWDIEVFDIVMRTEYGTTYNSYFIDAEKKTVIETVKETFSDTYLEKLRQLTDLDKIEYIVLDHTEPDHSGAMRRLVELAPQAVVVGSGNAIRYLNDIIDKPFKSMVVKDGDTLDLGNKTLKFIAAPNLHWPDSMFTYLAEDKILFTCDSFGAHYCSEKIFDDEVGNYDPAFTYYFDVILKPFSRFMLKAVDKIKPLDISMIATGHGPVLRSYWKQIVDKTQRLATEYVTLTAGSGEKKILITYVSAYGYTKEMAGLIARGASSVRGVSTEIMDVENADIGEIDSKLTVADGLLVGSPTINQNTLLPVYKLVAMVSPLRDKGKLAGAFGSYGWSGEAPRLITDMLGNLKMQIFGEPAAYKFVPGREKEESLITFGKNFALQLTGAATDNN